MISDSGLLFGGHPVYIRSCERRSETPCSRVWKFTRWSSSQRHRQLTGVYTVLTSVTIDVQSVYTNKLAASSRLMMDNSDRAAAVTRSAEYWHKRLIGN